MVFACAFMVALLFWRLRQPLILGYVFAGLILSPLTPGPQIHDLKTFEMMAEVGVILLMFSAGIEFSVPGLLQVKWVALIGAPIGISLSMVMKYTSPRVEYLGELTSIYGEARHGSAMFSSPFV